MKLSTPTIAFHKLIKVTDPEAPDACSFCSDVFNGVHGLILKFGGFRKKIWLPICGKCASKLRREKK